MSSVFDTPSHLLMTGYPFHNHASEQSPTLDIPDVDVFEPRFGVPGRGIAPSEECQDGDRGTVNPNLTGVACTDQRIVMSHKDLHVQLLGQHAVEPMINRS